MRHLDPSELVDFAEGRLDASRARHLDDCAGCRAQGASLAETLGAVRMDQVPEPSPLFWDHLSARIGEALDSEPIPQPAWLAWLPQGRIRVAAGALALVMLATIGGFIGWSWRSATIDKPSEVATLADELPGLGLTDDAISADAWDVIVAAADDLDVDEAQAAGLAARPGTAERVALELTPAERVELARLLEDELRKHGA
jgi:hypothetical protein